MPADRALPILRAPNAGVAQLVEQSLRKREVGGSSPSTGTSFLSWFTKRAFMKMHFSQLLAVLVFAFCVTGCARPSAEEQTDAVFTAYEKGDYQETLRLARPLAEQGSAVEQYIVGILYQGGTGVAQDYAQAASWFRKAADQNYPEAQNNLGVMYLHGRGVPQDPVEAARWFQKAADLGKLEAQQNLANAYRTGQGVPKDDTEATKWFRKAAEQGDADAQYSLGYALHAGLGTPADHAEESAWFRKAAEQGHAQARINVGMTYFKGMGVPQDYVQAHMWFNLAAASATDDDIRKQAATNRESVQAAMTPAQIADAQKMAREWQPGT